MTTNKVTPKRAKKKKKKNVIEWTGTTLNPTSGCEQITSGCANCYAKTISERLMKMGKEKYRNNFELTLHQEVLKTPYHWKKPTLVFLNSMSDLFHSGVTDEFIIQTFKMMNETQIHTYQVLTKRADRLAQMDKDGLLTWTPNIWMGTSVENTHKDVISRIDYLSQTKAHTKFLSCEPLLSGLPDMNLTKINWVIVGGESGPGARKVEKEWILDIQQQCKVADVPFFFKQWGDKKFNPNPDDPTISTAHEKHAKGGCELDGKVYREMPKVGKGGAK
ncbi:MAG: phage Gp37/Gp68 family protein [Bacteroidota bacterium]|nr:phage Gp37/Gp68 family protein [Bacteroidota bacterium]